MTEQQTTPQDIPEPESLTAQMAFRAGESDKTALRMVAFWNEETESEVLRRFFDFDGFRAEAERIRSLREAQKEGAVA